jgi:hypothetical protein
MDLKPEKPSPEYRENFIPVLDDFLLVSAWLPLEEFLISDS